MKCVLFVIALLFVSSSTRELEAKYEWGSKAKIENWPFLAYMVYYEEEAAVLACAGALLSSQTVLTAAHCLDDVTGYQTQFSKFHILIYMGNTNILESSMVRTVIDYQSHFEYKIHSSYADIGVAFLEKPVLFSKTVKKTLLAPILWNIEHKTGFVAGWHWQNGNSLNNDTRHTLFSDTLFFLKQKINSNERCKKEIQNFKEGQMCAGDFQNTAFIYGGNAGAPLVTRTGYQLGVVSYTAKTAVTVYTNTTHFHKWIRKTQKQLFKNNCAFVLDSKKRKL